MKGGRRGSLHLSHVHDTQNNGTMESLLRLCLLGMLEATPIKSHQHDCPNELDKNETNGLAN